MNPRFAAIAGALLVLAAVLAFALFSQNSTGEIEDHTRVKPPVEDVTGPSVTPKSPPKSGAPQPQPTVAPTEEGALPVMELADAPDQVFDPMSHYPLTKQGLTGAFREMQIEFDACREERGVTLDPKIQVRMTMQQESPPHEEYGIEEGEIWGMVGKVEVLGQDAAAMKPFTDCVQNNLHDLLFDPPKQQAVTIDWPITFQ